MYCAIFNSLVHLHHHVGRVLAQPARDHGIVRLLIVATDIDDFASERLGKDFRDVVEA